MWLRDALGEDWMKWGSRSRKFMQEAVLVIQVQGDGGR